MKRDEIGGEFWERPAQKVPRPHKDIDKNPNGIRWFISGRTALDYIIRDIIRKRGGFSVAMPSYYCYSMLEPFLRNGVGKIEFYDVTESNDGIHISSQITADVVYVMDYFGILSKQVSDIVNKYSQKGKIIICDLTQSVFCRNDYVGMCDYAFCSYRKWFFSNAAVAVTNREFDTDYVVKEDEFFTPIRVEAAREKDDYIHCVSSKKDYLEKYHQADRSLKDNYIGFTPYPDEVKYVTCVDDVFIARRRKENAAFIIRELKECANARFRFFSKTICETDVPLFVPILMDNSVRYNLREYLKQQNVYCPVHWPITDYHDKLSEKQKSLYNNELSLICDQRYNLDDMKRQVNAIKSFFEENHRLG